MPAVLRPLSVGEKKRDLVSFTRNRQTVWQLRRREPGTGNTHHDSALHQVFLVAEHRHTEVTELLVQKPPLIFPQLTFTVDDSCNGTEETSANVLKRMINSRCYSIALGGASPLTRTITQTTRRIPKMRSGRAMGIEGMHPQQQGESLTSLSALTNAHAGCILGGYRTSCTCARARTA